LVQPHVVPDFPCKSVNLFLIHFRFWQRRRLRCGHKPRLTGKTCHAQPRWQYAQGPQRSRLTTRQRSDASVLFGASFRPIKSGPRQFRAT
jgi:hypothetical protein